MLGVSSEKVVSAIESVFAAKPALAKLNASVSRHAYSVGASLGNSTHTVPKSERKGRTILVQGYHGTAIGKLVCGCRMQPYYPITPATDESYFLESNQKINSPKPGSVIVVQTEDEICAIGMAVGSALTGCRTATCTSGPGFSLMTETLGWAGINETPVVITLYQRSGPSTGLPTRHGQDDLMCAVHAGHGEFPRLVYASGDVEVQSFDIRMMCIDDTTFAGNGQRSFTCTNPTCIPLFSSMCIASSIGPLHEPQLVIIIGCLFPCNTA